MIRFLAIGFLGVLLFAQPPSRDTATTPRIISRMEPSYSEEARLAGLMGTVKLKGIVGVDGRAADLQVVEGLGMGLDENAIDCVRQWRFKPGTKAGEPADVVITVEVPFHLLDKHAAPVRWHLARAEFQTPPDASRPELEKSREPHLSSDASARVIVTFEIDQNGIPKSIHADAESDKGWTSAVTSVLGDWRFKPASKDGNPIAIPCTMDFIRGK
jgi:TonB family protein